MKWTLTKLLAGWSVSDCIRPSLAKENKVLLSTSYILLLGWRMHNYSVGRHVHYWCPMYTSYDCCATLPMSLDPVEPVHTVTTASTLATAPSCVALALEGSLCLLLLTAKAHFAHLGQFCCRLIDRNRVKSARLWPRQANNEASQWRSHSNQFSVLLCIQISVLCVLAYIVYCTN